MKNKDTGFKFENFYFDVEDEKNLKLLIGSYKITVVDNNDLKILALLIAQYPNPVKNEIITQKIYPTSNAPEDLIRHSINHLRKAFDDNDKEEIIQTIRKQGYKLGIKFEKVQKDSSDVETTRTETERKDEIIINEATKTETEVKNEVTQEEISQSQKKNQNSFIRRIMPWALLVVVIIGLPIGLSYYLKKESFLLTNYKVTRSDVTLNLNNGGWRDLTESEAKSEDKLSKAVTQISLEVEKQYENDGDYVVRLGNTQGPEPELDNFNNLPMKNGGRPEDIKGQFSFLQLKSYNSYKFSFEDKKVNVPFLFSYRVNNFNAHNKKPTEFHRQVIYYQTENLTIRIIFPDSRPFKPNEVTYGKKEYDDLNEYQKQSPTKVNSPVQDKDEYVIEEPSGKEIIWHIKKPDFGYIYSIEWNW